mmetsp:Transcript_90712/g.259161  ORF Transcript_90712/g.259161 Transcript_90712/m.259161 type:complete len:198 (+) Transcript_90712:294-887(+)
MVTSKVHPEEEPESPGVKSGSIIPADNVTDSEKRQHAVMFRLLYPFFRLKWSIRRATIPNVFMKILAGKIKATLIAENEHCIVLRDLHSVSENHLLVIPRKKIESWKQCSPEDLDLLRAMKDTAMEALTSLGVAEEARALGFMTPPYNTQYQLHLHALERPVTAKGLRGSAFDLDYSPIFKSMDYVQEQVAKKKART